MVEDNSLSLALLCQNYLVGALSQQLQHMVFGIRDELTASANMFMQARQGGTRPLGTLTCIFTILRFASRIVAILSS